MRLKERGCIMKMCLNVLDSRLCRYQNLLDCHNEFKQDNDKSLSFKAQNDSQNRILFEGSREVDSST